MCFCSGSPRGLQRAHSWTRRDADVRRDAARRAAAAHGALRAAVAAAASTAAAARAAAATLLRRHRRPPHLGPVCCLLEQLQPQVRTVHSKLFPVISALSRGTYLNYECEPEDLPSAGRIKNNSESNWREKVSFNAEIILTLQTWNTGFCMDKRNKRVHFLLHGGQWAAGLLQIKLKIT